MSPSMAIRVFVTAVGLLLRPTFSISSHVVRSELSLLQVSSSRQLSSSRTYVRGEGARFVLLHIALPGNEKHSLDSYANALDAQCAALGKFTDDGRRAAVEVLGSVGWIAESAPSCAPFLSAEGHELSEANLPLTGAGPLWTNCSKKFSKLGSEPMSNFDKLAHVWLNKLAVACDVAEKHPDEITVFMDSNLYTRESEDGERVFWEQALNASSKLLPGRLGMPSYPWEEFIPNREWYGQDQCRTPPRLSAKYIAVRGRDCAQMMDEYLERMEEVFADPTCGCWDEEMIFASMYSQNSDLFDTDADV